MMRLPVGQHGTSRSSKERQGAASRSGGQATRLTKTDGKAPGILDISPHPPQQQCRKPSPLSSAASMELLPWWNPPLPRRLSQRLSFQAFLQIPHSSHFLPPQSGSKSSKFICSMEFPKHPRVPGISSHPGKPLVRGLVNWHEPVR